MTYNSGDLNEIGQGFQQFQIQNLMALKALHQEDFTILDNLGDRWNGAKSF